MITFLIVCVGRDLPESLLLHDALQRMLVFAGKVHNLRLRATYADYADGMGTTLLCVENFEKSFFSHLLSHHGHGDE